MSVQATGKKYARDSRLACHLQVANCIEATPVPVKPTQYPDFFDPFLALPFFVSVFDVVVVPLVLIVPMDPAVPLVSVDVMPVAEVSVDDIVLVIEVEDVLDIVLVIPVSVAAVSVAFSSFLQPNAKIAITRSERTVSERDFFISFSLFNFAGKPGRNVSAARSRGAIV